MRVPYSIFLARPTTRGVHGFRQIGFRYVSARFASASSTPEKAGTPPVKWGILGAGAISNDFAKAIQSTPGSEVRQDGCGNEKFVICKLLCIFIVSSQPWQLDRPLEPMSLPKSMKYPSPMEATKISLKIQRWRWFTLARSPIPMLIWPPCRWKIEKQL